MNAIRNILFAVAALFAFNVAAQGQRQYEVLNPPQPSEGGGKVEVIEFFWYGCPHCYSLEPSVNAWTKNLPKDVVFKRVPAYANDNWGQMVTVYYTLEAMGLIEQYHGRVFDAMHKENKNLANKNIREQWLAANGIDVAKYNDVEKSFSVASKVQRARQLTQSYKVDSVPRIFVNGKYYTGAEMTGTSDRVFQVVDELVAMARKESGATAAGAPAKK